jgi:hypothetical protein
MLDIHEMVSALAMHYWFSDILAWKNSSWDRFSSLM